MDLMDENKLLLLLHLASGHLSSSSIYPVCLAPYLIVTTCSDSRVRFWRCAVEGDEGYSDEHDNRAYRWEPWALMNEEEDNNSAVCVSGRPVAVSCSYIGRLAVAFKQPRQGQVHLQPARLLMLHANIIIISLKLYIFFYYNMIKRIICNASKINANHVLIISCCDVIIDLC